MKYFLVPIVLWISWLTLTNLSAQAGNISVPRCGLGPGTEKYSALQKKPNIFRGKFFSKLEKITIDKAHHWFLYLEDQEGKPVENARIEANGINRKAGKGLGRPPEVSGHIGRGHYLVKNVNYSAPGTWSMRFQVIQGNKAEVLAFDVEVETP